MKHRNLKRFLTLTAACVASLGFGAYLSYQAAEHDGAEPVLAAAPAAVISPAVRAEAAASPQSSIQLGRLSGLRASLVAQEPREATVAAVSDETAPQQATPESTLRAELSETTPVPEGPNGSAPLRLASLEAPDLPPLDMGQARSAPLPPRRPASFAAASSPEAPAASPAQPAPAAAAASGAFPAIVDALAAMSGSSAPTSMSGSSAPSSMSGSSAPAAQAPAPEFAPAAAEKDGKFKLGAAVYVRIFKQEGALELWMKHGDHFALFHTFPICKWSGRLGPKQKYADYQSPEGFYSVSAKQLNPHSAYHLAFDIGYPNAYDRRHGATGNAVMVHGDCKSVGCFAMTNRGIDGIYKYVAAALANGQKEVPVHIFPFRMTEQAIARESSGGNVLAFLSDGWSGADWSPFWHNLKQGYDMFEQSHVPPVAYACGDRYEFGAAGAACSRIAGW